MIKFNSYTFIKINCVPKSVRIDYCSVEFNFFNLIKFIFTGMKLSQTLILFFSKIKTI